MTTLPRNDDGTLPAYAWPGGYPIVYIDRDNSVLCPRCANRSDADPDETERFKPIAADIHWEGEPLICDNCGKTIESAYGETA